MPAERIVMMEAVASEDRGDERGTSKHRQTPPPPTAHHSHIEGNGHETAAVNCGARSVASHPGTRRAAARSSPQGDGMSIEGAMMGSS